MKHRVKIQRLTLMSLGAMLLLFLLTSSACICDPGSFLWVNNQTDQTLGIFIEESRHGDVPPGEIKGFNTMEIYPKDIYPADKKFLIEAKTEDGEVIYSEEFTWQELDDMDWTIVIPPPPE